jgi:Flp pilus assembly protein TadD
MNYRGMMATQASHEAPTLEDKLSTGDRLYEAGDLSGAMWAYVQARLIDPEDPTPGERIAYLRVYGNPARAEAMFKSSLDKNPKSVSAHVGLGLARLALGRLKEARESLERALELEPDSVAAHSGLGAVFDRMGMHPEAQAQLQAANELRPKDARILNNLGVSFLLSEDRVEAEQAFREAIQLDPKDPALRNNLGLTVGLQGRYDEALEHFRQGGTEEAALNNLGYVYFLNGRLEEAREHYERALVADGEDKLTVLYNLSAVRDALGEISSNTR